jgi:hypothetical protein
MSEQVGGFEREVRDTIVKSSLTGVAATVLAVTIFSPAGLGGMIGTSLASSFGNDPNVAPADNPYANLPAYPSPLTAEEVSSIRGQLASTAAQMEFTRAATDAKIEQVRAIAMVDGAVTFTPMPAAHAPQLTATAPQSASPELRLTLSTPAAAPALAPVAATAIPVSYSGGGADYTVAQRDPHMELAELLLAHEQF